MAADRALSADDVAWLKSYATGTSSAFDTKFKEAGDRFKGSDRLLERFAKAVETVPAKGRASFRAVDEAHNELCIAEAILANPDPEFSRLDYEPSLAGCSKSIDFRAITDDGFTVFVDVKTIKPLPKDRWDQFEKALQNSWIPENVNVLLSKGWLGGELWHGMFAARSRMLEYALELEQKIVDCKLANEKTVFVLALCGDGFDWHEDGLEDFVAFYTTGFHRADDPFSKAEAKHIEDKKLAIARSITRFAYMRRTQGEIHHKHLNWYVRPPGNPIFAPRDVAV